MKLDSETLRERQARAQEALIAPAEGDWICEHTHPELWAEGRALVQAIHDRKAGRDA